MSFPEMFVPFRLNADGPYPSRVLSPNIDITDRNPYQGPISLDEVISLDRDAKRLSKCLLGHVRTTWDSEGPAAGHIPGTYHWMESILARVTDGHINATHPNLVEVYPDYLGGTLSYSGPLKEFSISDTVSPSSSEDEEEEETGDEDIAPYSPISAEETNHHPHLQAPLAIPVAAYHAHTTPIVEDDMPDLTSNSNSDSEFSDSDSNWDEIDSDGSSTAVVTPRELVNNVDPVPIPQVIAEAIQARKCRSPESGCYRTQHSSVRNHPYARAV